MDEIVYTTKYVVVKNEFDYAALNEAIGDSYQFPRSATEHYSDPNPQPINGLFYMQITPDVQKNHAECLVNIELVDSVPNETIEL